MTICQKHRFEYLLEVPGENQLNWNQLGIEPPG